MTNVAGASSFSAMLESPKVLKTIIEAIAFLIDETYMYVRPDGIKFNAIDSSHVAMLLALLPKALFTDYKCGQLQSVGVNIQDFLKILRRAKGSESVQLSVNAKDTHTLLVTMKNEKSTRTFKLRSKEIPGFDAKEEGLLESFEETLKDKFCANLTFESAVIDEIVKDSMIISDLLKVDVASAEKTVNFTASDEGGEVNIEIDLDGKGVLDKKVVDDAAGIYSLNFLENIIKIQAVTSSFEISLGNNIPMKIQGVLADAAGNPTEGKIMYLLAPRVEEQDDEFGDGEGIEGEIGGQSEENGETGDEGDGGEDGN